MDRFINACTVGDDAVATQLVIQSHLGMYLHTAITYERYNVVEYILQCGARVSIDHQLKVLQTANVRLIRLVNVHSLFMQACMDGNLKVSQELVSEVKNVQLTLTKLINVPSDNVNVRCEMIEWLILQGVVIDKDHLCYAAQDTAPNILQILLKHSPNLSSADLLDILQYVSNISLAQVLLSHERMDLYRAREIGIQKNIILRALDH